MKTQTRTIIAAALEGDDSIPPEVVEATLAVLDGKSQDAFERPLLLTMTAAARLSGMGRTWFWCQVRADQSRATKLFPPVQVSPGVYRYRRTDIERFVARTTTYAPAPKCLQQKIAWH